MKRAFSLIEIIIVIVIISIVTSFLIGKYANSLTNSTKITIKADIALINSSISKQNSKNTLLNEEKISSLDNATFDQKNSLLFTKVLDKPLVSTNQIEKSLGKWIKISSNRYRVFFEKDKYLEYQFIDNSFKCKSSLELCMEFE